MGARPQAALVSVTLPRMSEALQARSLSEIMAQAGAALRAAGAGVVGGHSTMGAEMSIGFTLTGLLERDPVTVAGARPGDALILTRPIGSGVLLAAEMRGKADGRDIAALMAALQVPQGDAAQMLAGAHAMTDVTGFGLAGHLMAICRASGVGAEIDLAALPVYPGAEALAARGVRSTIWAANAAAAPVAGGTGARRDLLHDPQTAGGLLAAIGPDDASALLPRLRAAGHHAAVIGRVLAGAPALSARDHAEG
jgi:selenide,water dikinase